VKVLVTGVNGFVGMHIARHLRAAGFAVVGTVRSEAKIQSVAHLVDQAYVYDLRAPTVPKDLASFDAIVHLAHDFSQGAQPFNHTGTSMLARAGADAGVPVQIYFTSYSAVANAVTEYGRSKFALESVFKELDAYVARPGLVIGSGGIFGRIRGLIDTTPVVPMLNGGSGLVPIVAIENLCEATHHIISNRPAQRSLNLFNPQLVSLKSVVRTMLQAMGKRRVLLTVPVGLVLTPLVVVKKLGITLPIDADNVRAFAHNQDSSLASDLLATVERVLGLSEMIHASLQAGSGSLREVD
jgi:nucleoside-diphosphate-sugar epimerase